MSTELSKDDKKRIKNCEYYSLSKRIMKDHEIYKNVNIGEVYFIKSKDYDGNDRYVTGGYTRDPAKYMVIHKDEGFIFAKRIIASGKLGKEISCLTIRNCI